MNLSPGTSFVGAQKTDRFKEAIDSDLVLYLAGR